MTDTRPTLHPSGRQAWKLGSMVLVRTTLSLSALLAAYFLIPTRSGDAVPEWGWLVLEMSAFAVIVGLQIPAIVKAKYPVLRAVETLALLVPLFLLMFARIYLSISLNDPLAFSEPLNVATALYFTVTVFASVGFGDIFARTDSIRLLVTLQMILNLIVFGAVIRLLALAARRGVERKAGQSVVSDEGGD